MGDNREPNKILALPNALPPSDRAVNKNMSLPGSSHTGSSGSRDLLTRHVTHYEKLVNLLGDHEEERGDQENMGGDQEVRADHNQ